MRILVIAPHADDEAFGMGATIAKLVAQGHTIHTVVVTCGDDFGFHHLQGAPVTREVRKRELEEVSNLLGTSCEMLRFTEDSKMDAVPIREVVGEIEKVQDLFCADRWYVAGPSFHQDHRVVFEASMAAARVSKKNSPKEILLYELPMYSMNHHPWNFNPQVWEEIESPFLDKKIQAAHLYASQLRESGPLSPEALRNWAFSCGFECGAFAAERFQLIRSIRRC
jgi:LmbE family N-acetylglucosaminyl deacetylase